MNCKILPLALPNEEKKPIDKELIKNMLIHGIEENPPEDRAIAWLIMARIYPLNADEWNETRNKYFDVYRDFIKFFKMEDYHTKTFPNNDEITEFGTENDQLMALIHVDMIRTAHHIPFFPFPENSDEKTTDILVPFRPHLRRLERLLYIAASVNPTLLYAQGFNELICPIFFTLLSAIKLFDDDWDLVEALSFFMLQNLIQMTELNELFTTQDKSSIILHRMNLFMHLVEIHDPREAEIIKSFDIHPLSFAFPWLNILFSQLFMMPDLVIVWDTLFANFDNLLQFANYIGVGIIKMMADKISADDYIMTMTTLKKTTLTCVPDILRYAVHCLQEDNTPKKKDSFFKSMIHKMDSKLDSVLQKFK